MSKAKYILLSTILISLLMIISSCQEKMICAAYQSAFILDAEKQAAYFSPFENDSLPRYFVARNKEGVNGVGHRHPYKQQAKEIRMVIMQHTYRDTRLDSAASYKYTVDSAALAEIDYSLIDDRAIPADSLAGAEVPAYDLDEEDEWSNTARFNYNVDMVKYMELVGNDVMLWQYERREANKLKKQEEEEKKSFWQKILDLFKPKAKPQAQDDEQASQLVEEETGAQEQMDNQEKEESTDDDDF